MTLRRRRRRQASIVCWWGISPTARTAFCSSAYAAAHTERLGFLLAHRPGFVAPTLAARKFATLDQVTGGRAAIHVISGGDDVDQLRDGDTLPKDERYARTDEYVHILKRIWTETGPVDHAGKYYRFAGASTAMRCVQQPRIPIYFGGASDAAIAVAGKHADVYALWGETHEQVRELTARVRAAAATARTRGAFQPVVPADPGADRGRSLGARRTDQATHLANCAPRPASARASRRTKDRAGCSPRRRGANGSTSGCGPVRRWRQVRAAIPPAWSAHRIRSPRHCATTTTSASPRS